MREVTEFPKFRRQILAQDAIHIMAVGFEDRCLAYPKILSGVRETRDQTFLAVNVNAGNVSQTLVGLSEQNAAAFHKLLPQALLRPKGEILRELRERRSPASYCLDTSSMPKSCIRDVLSVLLRKSKEGSSIFVTYSYPTRFVYGNLQEPASDVAIYYETPELVKGERVTALVMPGFDGDYTNMALGHIKAATGVVPSLRWLFSFPGRKYQFYERALETHMAMMGGERPVFFPQNEIAAAIEKLTGEITSIHDTPVFCLPLGCRLTCVPLFLAIWRARMQGARVNVLIPNTRQYNSLRSEGGGVPLIEELRDIGDVVPT